MINKIKCRKTRWVLLLLLSTYLMVFGMMVSPGFQGGEKISANVGSEWLIPATFSSETPLTQAKSLQLSELTQSLIPQFTGLSMRGVTSLYDMFPGVVGSGSLTTDLLEINGPPSFSQFLENVAAGDAKTIIGIYVEGILGLEVVQQPRGNPAYVSSDYGTATQFYLPADFGVVGLLAHNYLSGSSFLRLLPGHEIRLVYGDGSYQRFRVSGVADFERLSRLDVYSNFRDLSTRAILSSTELFVRFYTGDNHLTLQTCLAGEGYADWGLRMVSAVPLDTEN